MDKELVKSQINLESYLSFQGIKFQKVSKNRLKLNCPFHADKDPSFIINFDQKTFHCFSCGFHGDIFDFHQELTGLNFQEALRDLANISGIEWTNRAPRNKPLKKRIVWEKEYVDQDGALIFKILKYQSIKGYFMGIGNKIIKLGEFFPSLLGVQAHEL